MYHHLFYVNNIENMYVMKDENGNSRCILNCLYLKYMEHTIKLAMDIVLYEGETYFNFIDNDESSVASIQ